MGGSAGAGRVDLAWLPPEVAALAGRLRAAGHTAFLVGGAVRDRMLGRTPADYDLATTARPAQVLALLPGAVADDAAFGRVKVGGVDVLTLRREAEYRDRRRPSQVRFTRSVRADLARRDFTVNAMAVDLADGTLVDPWGGRRDLELGILRTVGPPERRFAEDALRVLRAVRLRAQLGLSYHPRLAAALGGAAPLLEALSAERVRDEMGLALVAPGCGGALRDLQRHALLDAVLPECLPMVGCPQRTPMHRFDVWEHSVRAAAAVAPALHLRWAALLHDAGKPSCLTWGPDGATRFYGHAQLGAQMAGRILRRLRLPERVVARVVALVAQHMFSYGPETKPGAARRLLLALGAEGVDDLLELRRADRQASLWGQGYGPEGERLLAHRRAIAEAGERLRLADLAVGGHDVMEALGLSPGPAVGEALRALHRLVLDDALPNERAALLGRLAAGPLPGDPPEPG